MFLRYCGFCTNILRNRVWLVCLIVCGGSRNVMVDHFKTFTPGRKREEAYAEIPRKGLDGLGLTGPGVMA